jgi:hypothetical protein
MLMSATVVGLNIYGSELTRNRHRRQADTHPALRPDPAPLRSFGDEVRGGDLLRHAETAARLGEPHREEITTEFASREGVTGKINAWLLRAGPRTLRYAQRPGKAARAVLPVTPCSSAVDAGAEFETDKLSISRKQREPRPIFKRVLLSRVQLLDEPGGDVFFLVFVRWSKTGPSASTPLRAP